MVHPYNEYYLTSEKWSASTDMEKFPSYTKGKKQVGKSLFELLPLLIKQTEQKLITRDHEFQKQSWDEEYLSTTAPFVLFPYYFTISIYDNSQHLKWSEINQMGKEIVKWLMWIFKLKHDNILLILLCGLIKKNNPDFQCS